MMFSKHFVFMLASLLFINQSSAGESIKIADILSALESTRIDSVEVQLSLVRRIFGGLPPASRELTGSTPLISHVRPPESTCVFIYDRQRGTRFTDQTHGEARNVRNNVQVLLDPNHWSSDGDTPWNVAYCAYQSEAGELPIVHTEPPVQMMMLWLDPLSTTLF